MSVCVFFLQKHICVIALDLGSKLDIILGFGNPVLLTEV